MPCVKPCKRPVIRWLALVAAPLTRLPDKGLAHDHVRLEGRGCWRVCPSKARWGCRLRTTWPTSRPVSRRSGWEHPALHGVLPPSEALPRGALLVEEIVGRPARLPDDLPALAQSLAALHALPLPPAAGRPPLRADADPLQALSHEVREQAAWWPQAGCMRK
jgi:hypothetical protein